MILVGKAVARTDDDVRSSDIQFRVELVGLEGYVTAADVLRREVYVLLYLLHLGLCAGGGVLEGSGTDGADLRTQCRHGDDGHYLAAHGGLDKLDVSGFLVVLQLHCIGGAAGIQLDGEAGSKVAAVDAAADKDG